MTKSIKKKKTFKSNKKGGSNRPIADNYNIFQTTTIKAIGKTQRPTHQCFHQATTIEQKNLAKTQRKRNPSPLDLVRRKICNRQFHCSIVILFGTQNDARSIAFGQFSIRR